MASNAPTLHQQLLSNRNRFYQVLEEFYQTIGKEKELAVPKVDKRALDLHLFYTEVTKRGGYKEDYFASCRIDFDIDFQKCPFLVTKNRKWMEVARALNFHGHTSISTVLKKHYVATLLDKFEDTYFPTPGTSAATVAPAAATAAVMHLAVTRIRQYLADAQSAGQRKTSGSS